MMIPAKAESHLHPSKMLPSLVSLIVTGQQLQRGLRSLIILHDKCQVCQLAHLTLCGGSPVLGGPPCSSRHRPGGLRGCIALAPEEECFQLIAQTPSAHCHLYSPSQGALRMEAIFLLVCCCICHQVLYTYICSLHTSIYTAVVSEERQDVSCTAIKLTCHTLLGHAICVTKCLVDGLCWQPCLCEQVFSGWFMLATLSDSSLH